MRADPRKGLVYVEVGDDELIHFKWKDRTRGSPFLVTFFKFLFIACFYTFKATWKMISLYFKTT